MLPYRFISCLLVSFAFSYLSQGREAVANPKTIGSTSLCFIENKGQVMDQFGKARNDIQFKLQAGSGLNIFIGNGALHYVWSRQLAVSSRQDKEQIFNKQSSIENSNDTFELYRMDVKLLNTNTNAQIIVEEQQEYFERYFNTPLVCNKKGQITNLDGLVAHTYKKITYKNIYPNIDWVIYVSSSEQIASCLAMTGGEQPPALKYDFIVHPGGDTKDIQLEYGGATSLVLNEDKSITATTPFGSITENAPYSYLKESREEVASKFLLKNNILSFNVENYSGTLVIDPSLGWVTYYGGSSEDRSYGLTCDGLGNILMTGYTSSTGNIATTGSYQNVYGGGSYDVFITKFNGMGALQWATYYGGDSTDQAYDIVCDASNNIYVTGSTKSSSAISSIGSYQSSYGGGNVTGNAGGDAFLAKFNSSGSLQWSTYYGGTSDENSGFGSVVCEPSGNVFITGVTGSTTNMTTTGSYQTAFGGGSTDAYIAKFSSTGTLLWASYFGGSGADKACSIAYGIGGGLYINGNTSSTSGIATPGSYQVTFGGGSYDNFLAKFNSSGAIQWATYYGGSNTEGNNFAATDVMGNVYMTGITYSTTNIATVGSYQSTFGGAFDTYLAKFNSSGSLSWATYFGGSSFDNTFARPAFDTSGNVYITGGTSSSSGIATMGSYQTVYGGSSNNTFLAKFTNSGSLKWGTYFGGNNITGGTCIAGDGLGNIYFSGSTTGTSNISTAGSYQSSFGGGSSDVYLAKLGPDTFAINQAYTDTLLCAGDTFSVHFTYNFTFAPYANIFTVQLSNAAGSFGGPVNIGISSLSGTGSILCTVPPSIATGNGYRIRITTLSPTFTTIDNGVNIHIVNLSSFTAIANNPVCIGDTLLLHADSMTNGISYTWAGPGSFSSSLQNPKRNNMQLIDSGKYIVTASIGNCIAKDTVSVIVNPALVPSVTITTNPSPVVAGVYTVYTANPTNGGTPPIWQWKKNSVNITGATNPTYPCVPLAHDTICIVMQSTATCPVPDTAKACNVAPLRVAELKGQKGEWVIWPNPVRDELNVEIASYLAMTGHEARLRIFNVLGQEVFETLFENKTRISMKDFAPGTYILQITDSDGDRIMRKVVKE